MDDVPDILECLWQISPSPRSVCSFLRPLSPVSLRGRAVPYNTRIPFNSHQKYLSQTGGSFSVRHDQAHRSPRYVTGTTSSRSDGDRHPRWQLSDHRVVRSKFITGRV